MAAPEQINDTITTGGTAQVAVAADKTRRQICIQALDQDMWCNFLDDADVDQGFLLLAGWSRTMRFADWPMIHNALSVVCATTGSRFTVTTDIN